MEGPEWVAKQLLDLKEHELFLRGKLASPNRKLTLGVHRFYKTPENEIRPMNVIENMDEDGR